MFYDLNIQESFDDFNEIWSNEIKGACIVFTDSNQDTHLFSERIKGLVMGLRDKEDSSNHAFNENNFIESKSNSNDPVENSANKSKENLKLYTRINIPYNNKLDQATMTKLRRFNLVCINKIDNSNINSVLKLEPDLITLNLDFFKHIKKSFINQLKEKEMFVELSIRDALYGSKERVRCMSCIRKLIKLGCYKNLVISSGAGIFTEVKRPADILKILSLFGLSDDRSCIILNNSERVLRKAALKRHSFRGAISNSVEADNFKNDFIINY